MILWRACHQDRISRSWADVVADVAASAFIGDDSWYATFAYNGSRFGAAFFAHRAEAILISEAKATLDDRHLRTGGFFGCNLRLRRFGYKAAKEITSGKSGHGIG